MQTKVVGNILHEELILNLRRLAAKAKSRFSKLSIFSGSSWEDEIWLYRGKEKLNLLVGEGANEELSLLNKVFVVNYLWDRRANQRQVSAARARDLVFALRFLAREGVCTLLDLNQEYYARAFAFIKCNYKFPEGNCRVLNIFVRFLFESGLSPQKFDLIGTAGLEPRDQYGRVAIESKLPLPDLVKAIISLRWAIQDRWDGSLRAQIDLLAVLTQVFQYGLGLRMGEVLRLPKDCLILVSGEMYCRVWTEKGAEPIARYVPTIWRSALSDAVDRINSICQPYRVRAASIEDGSFAKELDDRFQERVISVNSNIQSALERLHRKIDSNVSEVKHRLQPIKFVPDGELIELKRLGEYLPATTTSRDASSLLKFYKKNGFNVISKPLGKVKCAHYVLGKDLNSRLQQLVKLRSNVLFYDEFFEILHGRKPSLARSKDRVAFEGKLKFKVLPSIVAFAWTGEFHQNSLRTVYIDYADALAVLRTIAGGGYDAATYIPLLDAEQLYPEFFNQKTMTYISGGSSGFFSFLKISKTRLNFYRLSSSSFKLNYLQASGFLIEQSSIKDAVVNTFVSINARVSSEQIEVIKEDFLAEGVEISSAAFGVHQKVSDYLFVVPGNQGSVYNEHLPSLFGYRAVLHALKPRILDRSAFIRYGVTNDNTLIKSFQTHKARHWQTNSLFRAGLAASIVNKWMGRTDSQGDHYDHQTPRERAAKVGELMLSEQSRFIGDLASRIKIWTTQNIPEDSLQAHLNNMLQTVHYGPLGHCLRDINLKPCEFHLKCLTGNSGKGCREFIVDLSDPIQIKQIEAERSRAENELARLFEVLNRPGVPVESVEMHIEHQMTVFRNACYILERSEVVLTSLQVKQSHDYQPFLHEGSIPSDCVFQCGGEKL